MSERITNTEIKAFLRDFALYSETEILEEGKEKNEVIAIAKTKDIDLQNNRDLAGFKTIYTFADIANKNRARLPKKALLKALPTMIGKPVDIDHNRRYVVGHYIDYRYKQKEDMVIAYGVFYKSNFGEEWEKIKGLFKANKLATSYEIWCPTDKRRNLADGTYELLQQEIAGGALLLKEDPAFEDAKVLELAKKNSEAIEAELVYAQYKAEDLIIGEEKPIESIGTGGTNPEITTAITSEPVFEQPIGSAENGVVDTVDNKVKCSNCGEEFSLPLMPTNEIKCKKCFAILDKAGNLVYPPQLVDFKMTCPNCRINNWLIMAKHEDTSMLKCLHCSKEYKVTFDKKQIDPLLEKIEFIYEGTVSCYQCGNSIGFSGISSIKSKTLKCDKCGLEFAHDIDRELHKKISKIEEIKIDKNQKSSEEGGTEMKTDDTVKASETKIEVPTPDAPQVSTVEPKAEEKVETPKVEEVKPEVKQEEVKVEETKAVEQPEVEVQAQEAPQAEEKPVEARFEYQVAGEEFDTVEPAELIEAEKISPQQRKGLDDKMFAVVVTVKNKKTGGTRKVRMFPIHDEAHVRNALARLGQEAPKETLNKLGVSVDTVRAKILRRAKELKMTDLLKRYKSGVNKLAKTYKKMKKVMMDECAFYKQNAGEIAKRREELGEFASSLSDKEIMLDDKYVEVKVKKENASIVKASKVGEKSKNDAYYNKIKQEIDKEAFGNK
jgi:hypothetical protein